MKLNVSLEKLLSFKRKPNLMSMLYLILIFSKHILSVYNTIANCIYFLLVINKIVIIQKFMDKNVKSFLRN